MDDSRTGTKNPFKKSDKYLILFLIVSLLLVNAVLNFIFGQSYKKYTKFNINNISTYVWNNGEMDKDNDRYAAFQFPINNEKHLFYASGFLWGGIINGQVYVNGTTNYSGVLPGRILPNGTADNEEDEKYRVYKVSSTSPDYEYDISLNKNNKSRDWKEWPAKWGAPFYDKNNNGLYEPEIDIPGKKGAHQTLWFVTNDLNTENTNSIFIKRPMGLEIQTTIWGYNNISELSNIIFKELKIINKSAKDITEFYSAIWTDSDIGNATDDFSGCDTTLNLGYSYNGTDEDKVYNKLVPAAGYCYLEDNINGSNRIYENINAFVCEFPRYNYSHGHSDFYWFEYYQYFKGRIGTTGEIFVDPNTGKNTKYVMAGDPINRTGWIDGQLFPPGDRKHLLSVGPYNLKPNDTLTVIFAQLAALEKTD